MGKALFIAEKPSVAMEFAKALKLNTQRRDGYIEANNTIITWCVGHLVTMSYPEKYDPKYKRWLLNTLPFIPDQFRYEVIGAVSKQFQTVKDLLTDNDVEVIYVCTDSGREGEYIYRLVEQMAGVKNKERKRVWIDSQTEEEIRKGIKNAKDLSAYDKLADAAYLRAKEDYLMGINFSRVLTLRYGNTISGCMKSERTVISVGRVMTCVLGMVVRREWDIRNFTKTPFYRVTAKIQCNDYCIETEWKAVKGTKYFETPYLYKENGFKKKEDAQAMIDQLSQEEPVMSQLFQKEKKTEKKAAPLLYNLAELQNECSRIYKLNPDETLKIVQELYEKKLVTYPRTDARVLSTAAAKEIHKNIQGLISLEDAGQFARHIMENKAYGNLAKTRYVNDKQITDHYAIVPTGQGMGALKALKPLSRSVYSLIVRRFLSIFYPPAEYHKFGLEFLISEEHFFTNFRVLVKPGYLQVADSYKNEQKQNSTVKTEEEEDSNAKLKENPQFIAYLAVMKKNEEYPVKEFQIKEGETSPPKRYNSGSIILAMENAGQLIEDEELRAQIKGSGIGTSATRAEILKKLVNIQYLLLNKKTQIITPTLLGETIYHVVYCSMRSLLNPELTASWEKGLTQVADGTITSQEYMDKLSSFVSAKTNGAKATDYSSFIRKTYIEILPFYQKENYNKKKSSGEKQEKA